MAHGRGAAQGCLTAIVSFVGPVVLAQPKDIQAHLVGQLNGLDQVAQSLLPVGLRTDTEDVGRKALVEHLLAQRRGGRRQLRAAAHLRVAGAGDEIADGIVQIHDRPLTSST